MRLLGSFLLAVFVCVTATFASAQLDDRRVAVTLDDGPLLRLHSQPTTQHGERVVDGLIEALAAHDAPAALFVVGLKLERHPETAVPLLERWIRAGVEIGNHTHRHLSIDRLGADVFAEDIDRAAEFIEPILDDHGRSMRYFRAPYLHEGSTAERQTALAAHLDERGLRNAPTTMAIEDWRFNDAYEEAEREGDWWQRAQIGHAYLEHARGVIDQMDALGREVTGRDVAHVLLLHANTINRDYLKPILDHLRDRGYRFVDLDEAYRDPVYREPLPPTADGGSVLVRLGQAAGLLAGR